MTIRSPAALPNWLAHRAHATPGREALVAADRRWTFHELDGDATRLAYALGRHGVRAGDRVATLLHNGPLPVLLVHAVLRLGATLVPLNVRLSAGEVAWQLGDARPRIVVVEARTTHLAAGFEAVVDGEALMRPGERSAPGSRGAVELTDANEPSHVVAIIYTSGTTGRAKGSTLTAANAWWSAVGSALNLGTLPSDRWLAVLPLFHVGGLAIVLRAAIYGITAVVHDSFDADAVNRAIDEDGVTIVSVVAVMLQRMLDARGGRPYPAALRCILLGGGPAPRALLDRCRALCVPVVLTYGLTETGSQVATLPPDEALRKLGSAGRALYPNAIRITSDDGTPLDTGTDGEIQVNGPVVTPGYVGVDGTPHLTPDGWLRTGDIGHLDADGYLYVLDRRDDLIITGGENVYPAEVEAVLLSHPSVIEAGVIGLPDERWGQRIVAIVRIADGADATAAISALRDHCRGQLAGYKVPAEVRVVAHDLPRTASGKLRRAALREALAAGPL